ncbi:hypothetical protein JTB14_037227 [Gonioctena quinquepunctata]|nr:hypothetical protein JTB14_037227 [Gonioctena quinquepunctata]
MVEGLSDVAKVHTKQRTQTFMIRDIDKTVLEEEVGEVSRKEMNRKDIDALNEFLKNLRKNMRTHRKTILVEGGKVPTFERREKSWIIRAALLQTKNLKEGEMARPAGSMKRDIVGAAELGYIIRAGCNEIFRRKGWKGNEAPVIRKSIGKM